MTHSGFRRSRGHKKEKGFTPDNPGTPKLSRSKEGRERSRRHTCALWCQRTRLRYLLSGGGVKHAEVVMNRRRLWYSTNSVRGDRLVGSILGAQPEDRVAFELRNT